MTSPRPGVLRKKEEVRNDFGCWWVRYVIILTPDRAKRSEKHTGRIWLRAYTCSVLPLSEVGLWSSTSCGSPSFRLPARLHMVDYAIGKRPITRSQFSCPCHMSKSAQKNRGYGGAASSWINRFLLSGHACWHQLRLSQLP